MHQRLVFHPCIVCACAAGKARLLILQLIPLCNRPLGLVQLIDTSLNSQLCVNYLGR